MLEETANSASYAGGDGQSVFPIPFPFIESSHIRASLRPDGGRASALAAGTDYAVNHTPDGYGELILLRDPLPDGSALVITRLVPLTQEILFRDHNPDYPRAVEEAADKLTMIAQQLKSGLDRCVAAPEGMSAGDFAAALVECAESRRQTPAAAAEQGPTVPADAPAGAFLCGEGGAAAWKSPGDAAGMLPLMSASRKGVARIADEAGLELDAGGALRICAGNLISKENLEARLAGLDTRLQALKTQMDALLRVRHPAPVGFEPPPDRHDAAPPVAPTGSTGGERFFLTRSGVYHTERCRYGGKGAGTWLSLAEILGGNSSARPCARCRPSPTEA